MRSCRCMAWVILPLAILTCRLVFCAGLEAQPVVPRTYPDGAFPSANWTSEATPLVIPLPKVDSEEPEVIATPAPAVPLLSDSSSGLTLADLEQIALESNPTLAQARMAIRAAEGGIVQASLYPNPVIAYAGADIGLDGTSGQQGG